MSQIVKPMLAGTCSSLDGLRYPVMATPKLDGIRCLVLLIDGKVQALSRNFKPIPNKFARSWLEQNCPPGFDGELMARDGTFQQTSSAIMSRDGEPDFVYKVFDYATDVGASYLQRMNALQQTARQSERIELVIPTQVGSVEALEGFESDCLSDGYEGVMVRDPAGPYKCGRSTEREGYLLKIKRFVDREAVVIGVEERMHNSNEATTDELGRTKRSSHKAGQIPMNTLGALIVRDMETGVEFRIGTGFDDVSRAMLWKIRDHLGGLIVSYKSQTTGVKVAPRFPIFRGFRSALPTFNQE